VFVTCQFLTAVSDIKDVCTRLPNFFLVNRQRLKKKFLNIRLFNYNCKTVFFVSCDKT